MWVKKSVARRVLRATVSTKYYIDPMQYGTFGGARSTNARVEKALDVNIIAKGEAW